MTLEITPSYSAVKSAQVVSGNELVINASNDPQLLQAIQQGFIINIMAGDRSFGLSLSGATEGVRRLLTCRDTNWRAAQRVYGTANNEVADSLSQTAPSGANASFPQIKAYPLDAEKEPVPADNGNTDIDRVVAVYAESDNDFVIETKTTKVMEQRGEVVDLSSEDHQQVVIEPVNTVTRVHTPKVRIQPRNQHDGRSAEAMVDVAVPLRGSDDLIKPPAFDESLLSEGQDMAGIGLPQTEMPIPERNPDARLSTAEESVQQLARKSDTEYEIHTGDDGVPKRNDKAMLSQSPDGIYTRPVVIPRIPEADLPSRIDITNRDVNDVTDSADQSRYASRAVSNEELERELKSREAAEGAYAEERAATTMPVTPTPVAPAPVAETPIRWNANQGDNLREILAKWSIEENVELIWDSEQQYALLSSVKMNASYEKVVAHVLNQFMVAPGLNNRPVGQLYVDPQSGNKVLIIQTDQG